MYMYVFKRAATLTASGDGMNGRKALCRLATTPVHAWGDRYVVCTPDIHNII